MIKHYLVSGLVQGVGYRRFIEKRGRENSVGGRVRNLADGRVEIVASGQEESVDSLEVYIERGPDSGQVKGIESKIIHVNINLPVQMTVAPDGDEPWSFD